MRPSCFLFLLSTIAFAQQPILYYRGTVNAASLTPFGLPNAPIARGGIFSVFGENLGPAQSPALAFPLSTTLGGVALTVTQSGVTTSAYPIFVSPGQINAIMPSTTKGGLATLRLTYNNNKSNAATIQISDGGPASSQYRVVATGRASSRTTSALRISPSILRLRLRRQGK